MEVLLELLTVFRACEHEVHVGVGQTEAIAVTGAHNRSIPTLRPFEQTALPRGRVRNNRRPAFGEIGEDVLLGSWVSSVVADYQHVQGKI